MIKISDNLSPNQVKKAFQKLPSREKIKLVKEFEEETRRIRWTALVKRIRARFKKNPISQKEINRICDEARTELYQKKS